MGRECRPATRTSPLATERVSTPPAKAAGESKTCDDVWIAYVDTPATMLGMAVAKVASLSSFAE